MTSIRRYLLIYLMFALTIGSVITATITYFSTKDELNELINRHLKQIAEALVQQQHSVELLEKKHGDEVEEMIVPHVVRSITNDESFLIQIWDEGHLAYSSHPTIQLPQLSQDGLASHHFDDTDWHTYTIHTEDAVIQVSQPLNARAIMIRELTVSNLIPLAAQLPILALFIWLAVGRSLWPLSTISTAIQKRNSSSLAPVPQEDVPLEVRPMVSELNDLLQRLGHSFQTQRQFTADAAHELRTPLTAVQLQLEILERAKSEEEKKDAMQKLSAGIQRSIHLVQQLLLLARLEPEAVNHPFVPVNLSELAKTSMEQFVSQAMGKNILFTFSSSLSALIDGDVEGLGIMVNNLIDNAIRYTPTGGKVSVDVSLINDTPMIRVMDNGVGIKPDDRIRIFDRFYRVKGTGTIGTGLGLAIVKTVADQHHAKIVIDTGLDGKGTSFSVCFPKK